MLSIYLFFPHWPLSLFYAVSVVLFSPTLYPLSCSPSSSASHTPPASPSHSNSSQGVRTRRDSQLSFQLRRMVPLDVFTGQVAGRQQRLLL